jgi:hypothetical protein
MSEAVNSLLTLFDGTSMVPESDIFFMTPGWFGVFTAFGFPDTELPADPGAFHELPRACLNQVHLGEIKVQEELPCGVYRPAGGDSLVGIMAEGPVMTGGCPWALSACQTVGVLDVPGFYRLILSHPATAGQVQIYLKAYPVQYMTHKPALLFGG